MNKKIIHLLLFLIEIIMILMQISEIHQKYYVINYAKNSYNFKPLSNLLFTIQNLPILISTFIYGYVLSSFKRTLNFGLFFLIKLHSKITLECIIN